jgi:glucose/arabinose dehydrogenase
MRRHLLILVSLLSGALLSGCGSDAASPTQPTPGAPAPPTSASQPAAPPTTAAQPADEEPAISVPGAPIALKAISDAVDRPVYITHAGDGSGRLFVVEKRGTIAILRDGVPAADPFLDITSLVDSDASERGLLGLAFHPDYANNGRFFVYYTAENGDNTVARYQVSGDADRADPATGVVLLAIEDFAANHNGGMIAFGPDGYLYVGTGDGGGGGDPQGNGQNREALLGKMLRLDVDGGEPYAIPADNPWASGGDGRPEVWAYGLRNPWRFSFDRETGDLYIGDVGQNAYEEVNVQRAGSRGGENYGWNEMEGAHCFRSGNCDPASFVQPIAEYGRDGGCTVVSGYVYRGAAFPSLQGTYYFADYCSGKIWSLHENGGTWDMQQVLESGLSISSFGEDQAGELYLVDLQGGVYQVIEAP